MSCQANKVALFGLHNLESHKWCSVAPISFTQKTSRKLLQALMVKKQLVLSIYIFDVKLQESYCFILW